MRVPCRLSNVAALALTLTCLPAAHAGWTGLSATGSISPDVAGGGGIVITSPFTSPQTVGAGIEFRGAFNSAFGFTWVVTADISDDTITIHFNDPQHPTANISSVDMIDVDIGGLTGAAGMTLLSYSCSPAGFPCNTFSGGPNTTYNSTSSSLHAAFNRLRSGETYVFGHAVPEPSSFALSALALAGLGAAARRRRQA